MAGIHRRGQHGARRRRWRGRWTMSPWDELLDRLTHRLRVDPELPREISRELLGHLEDSHLQFTAGGMPEDQPHAAAAKALGEEAEISRQIWEANRGRVRLRRVVKWAAGATLIPASAVLTVSLAWGAIASIALLLGTIGSGNSMVANLTRPIASHFDRKFTQSLPADARAVFVAQKTDHPQELRIKARELAEAQPSDPLYYANYVGKSLEELVVRNSYRVTLDAGKLTHVLPLLDRGMQIEP